MSVPSKIHISYPLVGTIICTLAGFTVFCVVSAMNSVSSQKALAFLYVSCFLIWIIMIILIIKGGDIKYRICGAIHRRTEIKKKYRDKIKQWEGEGYNVEELKRKWGFK